MGKPVADLGVIYEVLLLADTHNARVERSPPRLQRSLKGEAPETGMPDLHWRPKSIGDAKNIECPLRSRANSE